MKRVLLISILFASFSYSQIINLNEAIQIGIANSKNLKISKSKVDYSSAKISEISSQMLPQLKLSASYLRQSNIPPFAVTLPIFPEPIVIEEPILDNYSLKLSLQQPLFTGFRLTSLKSSSEYNKTAADIDFNQDMNDEVFNIQTAYWNLYKSLKLKQLVDENIQQMESHLSDTKNFFANDLVTKNDLLKIEVQVSSLKLRQIETDNNLNVSRALLNKTIGLPISNKTEIDSSEIKIDKSNYIYEQLLAEAKSNRNELKSLDNRIKAGEEGITAANSGWFPSIYFISDYYYSKPNQRILPLRNRFDDSWDVGISMNWDVWNWGYTSSQKEQAEQSYLQAKTNLAQLEDAVEVEVYNNYLALTAAYDKINVSKKNLEQADENYRIINEKYNVQLATSTDLLDAETSLLQAKIDLTTSMVDYQIAKVRLEKSAGRKIY
jgi:outer membrane protein TolC